MPFVSPVITTGEAVDAGDGVVHDDPPFVEYSMFEMASPPSLPAVKATLSWPLPGVIDVIVGAPGTVRGVPGVEEEAAPEPAAFTARSCTWYVVPFVNPVITTGEAVDTGERVVHDDPPSVEYS